MLLSLVLLATALAAVGGGGDGARAATVLSEAASAADVLRILLERYSYAYENNDASVFDELLTESTVIDHVRADGQRVTKGVAAIKKMVLAWGAAIDYFRASNIVASRNDGGRVVIGTLTVNALGSAGGHLAGCNAAVYEGWRVELDADGRLARVAAWWADDAVAQQCGRRAPQYAAIPRVHPGVAHFFQVISDTYALNEPASERFTEMFAKELAFDVPSLSPTGVVRGGSAELKAVLALWTEGFSSFAWSNLVTYGTATDVVATVTAICKFRGDVQAAAHLDEAWHFTFNDAGLITHLEGVFSLAAVTPQGAAFRAAQAAKNEL
eukprot:CAMPEP_0198309666 /NCGR_PEP_ID=MMETSP1450-20131203/1973_1 /TAXON_ID=753684 ORGANISM="Madagascaria erythrocladiodes, Strain CCMP3234" /NCGR_SAMPLE_ID=MMETSP1450 /ASSEMBLY_ACC=CAM_ASM_001115 /LENGTH=324 /DNA_ID=CAMNT_0044012433 /DNA_START=67 /DNA_END=1041 /DNA_ORIENTATION=-